MRGVVNKQEQLFVQINLSQTVPVVHPLRGIKALVDPILEEMSPLFDTLYSAFGAPSIPPEQLLKALLLQVLFTIRSERQLVEHLQYNLLYKWFLDLGIQETAWDASTFSKNRDRFLAGEVAQVFFERVLAVARERDLLSAEHFTVDGTLIEAWASMKSVRPKDEEPPQDGNGFKPKNPDVDFRGEKRSNETHASTTDPEAKLHKKSAGQETKLCYMGHVLMENRHGIAISVLLTQASGTAERKAALKMMDKAKPKSKRATLGGDKGYDVAEDVKAFRAINVTPHFARKKYTTLDARTTRHPGYHLSQKIRKRVEEIFGWLKTIGGERKVKHIGTELVGFGFTLATAAYNLLRIRNIQLEKAV
jgi:transposase/IS5 family transposase